MSKYPAAGFVQHEIPQCLIARDPAALVPDCVPWGWQDPTDNDIANLAFGMGGNDMDGFG